MNKLLKENKKRWDIKKDFNRNALPKIYDYVKVLRIEKPEIGRYNSAIADYILEREVIEDDFELRRYLETEVYLAQAQCDKEEKEEYKNKMIADGWLELTEDIVRKALEDKKKIHLIATSENMVATVKIDKILKPKSFNGRMGLLELRARTRGYSLSQFENAFCKTIK